MNEFFIAIESHPITALLCWLGLVIIAQALRPTVYYTSTDKKDD